jgi:hypothetical protein
MAMERDEVLTVLREHEAELRDAGVSHLMLFGSLARGETAHDVDLMAEFDSARRLTLLDMVGIESRLVAILGVPVDLAPANMLKEPIRDRAEREAMVAF